MASYQYIYVMQGVSKTFAGGKTVIKDMTLSFLPGAKIGVLGPNGSGKSTLLKIMAGVEKEFVGEARAHKGTKIGYLPQEPQLDASKTVFENVMEGVAETKALLDRYNEISMQFAEADADEMDKLTEEMGVLQEQIDAVDAWEIDRQVELAMQALNCPPKDASVTKLSGGEARRVALCRLLLEKPDMLLLDEPTNHLDAESVAWLQKFLGDYTGTVVMITHDRYFLDNVTGWILELDRGQGIPYEGNYSTYLEKNAKTPATGEPRRGHTPAHFGTRIGMGASIAQGTPSQVQGADQFLSRIAGKIAARHGWLGSDRHPDPAASWRCGGRGTKRVQGVWR